jgi:hypothetical protein
MHPTLIKSGQSGGGSVMAKTSPGPKVRFVDNPEAPEIFADAAKGVFLLNGNVHLTFTSRRSDYSNDQPGALYETVTCRIIMPLAAAEVMAAELANYVQKMKAEHQNSAPSETRILQ